MLYGLLADLIVIVHLGYVLFVLIGLVLIVLGGACGWSWVRNPWFRALHLLAIGIVALEAALNIECPLTTWERELRILAGQPTDGETFVGRLVHYLLFYQGPPEVFTACYFAVALFILSTFYFVPPRWRRVDGSSPTKLDDDASDLAPEAR